MIIVMVESSLKLQISEKLQITSNMQNWHHLFEKRNTGSIIPILSIIFYNENCHFNADFSTIAYVFVFSIIT